MNPNADLVIKDLANQVANLSKEKAIFYALVVQKEQEVNALKKELEGLKKDKPCVEGENNG